MSLNREVALESSVLMSQAAFGPLGCTQPCTIAVLHGGSLLRERLEGFTTGRGDGSAIPVLLKFEALCLVCSSILVVEKDVLRY